MTVFVLLSNYLKGGNLNTKKSILICGYYGSYNLGDEAMLAGMLKLLRELQDNLQITVFSRDTQDTTARHSVRAVHYRNSQLKIKHNIALLQNQFFILGGGDLLRDGVDQSIAKGWLRPLQQAIRLRRRTLVLGISVGEIWRKETQDMIPQVLNRVDLLTVRDADSKSKLEKLGVRKSIHIISDLALQFLPETRLPNQPVERPIQIGISIRPLNLRGRYTDAGIYLRYQQEMAAIADLLVEQYEATVHFLPFQALKSGYHSSNDDYVATLELLRYSRYSNHFVVHRSFESLHTLNQLISELDLVIGMRLHSLILAAGLGVPVIAAEYDSKVRGFMEEIGQAQHSIPLEYFERKQLLSSIDEILANPLMARKDVETGIQNYRQRSLGIQQALRQALA
ncbi:hypothetical protein CSQ79_02320 [Gloeocapsopsis sp. IPPAS B-1203]|nr:hypothetical protein CSQ79_02320 [Gloeocapsopsis sp. IPPAS B-1203]